MPEGTAQKVDPPTEPKEEEKEEKKEEEKDLSDTLHGTSDYSPEVTKLLKGWKKPFFGPGENKVIAASGIMPEGCGDGRKDVTWQQLHEMGYHKPAHGCRLIGDITQRDNQYWEHQKHVKLRDLDGTEHAVFFYVDDPYHWNYESMQVGGYMQINSPRLHRFMDGQDGMRLDEEKMVAKVWKSPLTDIKRLDYGELMKRNGNKKFEEGKFEDAVEFYENGQKVVTGSSWVEDTTGEQKKEAMELEFKFELNISQAANKLKNYDAAILHGRKALAIHAESSKAYLRIGQAALARGDNKRAVGWLEKALEYAPSDKTVSESAVRNELARAKGEKKAQAQALKGMYSGFLGGKDEFGAKKGTLALSGGLSELKTLFNFRDMGGRKVKDGRKMKAKLLYRSSSPAIASAEDIEVLRGEYGIKTVIDLRMEAHRRSAPKKRAAHFATIFKAVSCSFDKNGKASHSVAVKGATLDEVMKGRVDVRLDIIGTMFWDMLSFWLKLWAVILVLLFQKDTATKLTMSNSLGQLDGQAGLFAKVLDERGEEICHTLELISDPTNMPIVISCSEGKDMTALISILILGCLGAPDVEIEDDYLASDQGIGDERRKLLYKKMDQQGLDPALALVTRRTLKDTLAHIREREWNEAGEGGFEAYFDFIGFGVESRRRMRETLLPPLRDREDAKVIREQTDQEALRRRRRHDNFRPY